MISSKVHAFYNRLKCSIKSELAKYLDNRFILKLTTMHMGKLTCVPVKIFDSSSTDVKFAVKCKSDMKFSKIQSSLMSAVTVFQLLQCLYFSTTSNGNKGQTADLMFGLFSWIGLHVSITYIQIFRTKGPLLKVYLNNLLNFSINTFEKSGSMTNHNRKNFKLIKLLNLLLAPMIFFTIVIFPPCYVLGLHFQNPCKPSLVGYFLLNECRNKRNNQKGLVQLLIEIFLKTVIFVGNISMWYYALYGMAFVVITVHIISTMLISNIMEIFWNRLKFGRDLYYDAVLYRQIQVINILYNLLQQDSLLLFMYSQMTVVSVLLAILVGFMNGRNGKSNIVLVLTFVVINGEAVIGILVILGGMVLIYMKSKHILKDARRLVVKIENKRDRKWLRKFFRSCAIFRVKFGSSNFLEELTPFRCIDFAFNLTIQFVLLSTNT